jgi:hypothetical protein
VLAVNQKSAANKPLFRENQVAGCDVPGSKAKYLAVFNIGDTNEEEIQIKWAELGLAGNCAVRDLWEKKDLGTAQDGRSFKVAPHSAVLLRITAK